MRRWLPYLPLLNPLDVSVALAFAALAMWWSALDAAAARGVVAVRYPRTDRASSAGIVFLWLNAALIRTLHHNWGAPITAVRHRALDARAVVAVDLLGRARVRGDDDRRAPASWRYVWIVGAALMIVVVAKLFLVDLSSIGTIARIASFLTVGALLLITGYFAPLPPRRDAETPMRMSETRMMTACPCVSCSLLRSRAFAAAPTLDDYAQGIASTRRAGSRWSKRRCRTRCITGVTRADLGDVRVFNAEGMPVPHAFCAVAGSCRRPRSPSSRCRCSSCGRRLQRTSGGSRVEVQTAGGTQVNVRKADSAEAAAATAASTSSTPATVDAAAARDSVRLDQPGRRIARRRSASRRATTSIAGTCWCPASTLLLATRGDQEMQARAHRAAAAALQISARAASGRRTAAAINGVDRRARRRRRTKSSRVVHADDARDGRHRRCCSSIPARRAPVQLRAPAHAAGEQLRARHAAEPRRRQSAVDASAGAARPIWIVTRDGAARKSAGAVRRDQRSLLAPADREGSAARIAPTLLELGYRPARLRFLSQGPARSRSPSAAGARRLSAPSGCDALLADVSATERARWSARAMRGARACSGGDDGLAAAAEEDARCA